VTRRLGKLAAGMLIALVLLGTGSAVWAYFTTDGSGSAAVAIADFSAPTGVGATASGGSVTVSWTDVTAPDGGSVDGYLVERSDGTTWSAACGTSLTPEVLVDPSGDPTCEDQGVADGTYTYRVIGAWRSWTAASNSSAPVAVVNDSDAPTAVIGFPVNSLQYSAAGYLAGCGTPTGDLCGSASDASGVALVRVSVLRQSTNLYWNGTAFASATETYLSASLSSAGATDPTWNFPLPSLGTGGYTIHVQAQDTFGNEQTGATVAAASTFTVDATAPMVTINQAAGQSDPTHTSPVHFTATFSEPVTGFDATDVVLTGTGVAGASVSVSGSSDVYTVVVSNVTDNGTQASVIATIAAGAAADSAGNANSASTSTDNTVTYDATAPSLISLVSDDVNHDGKLDGIVATFGENLAACTAPCTTGWSLANAPAGASISSVTVSGATATINVGGTTAVDTLATGMTVSLTTASGITDAAGNHSAFTATAVADGMDPIVVSVTDTDGTTNGRLQAGDSIDLTFSEALLASSVPSSATVSLTDPPGGGNDTLAITGVLASSSTGSDGYVSGNNRTASFASSAVTLINGGTTIHVVVGATCTGNCGDLATAPASASFAPVPVATLKDVAGNGAAAGTPAFSIRLF
jgi:hypothetical protein